MQKCTHLVLVGIPEGWDIVDSQGGGVEKWAWDRPIKGNKAEGVLGVGEGAQRGTPESLRAAEVRASGDSSHMTKDFLWAQVSAEFKYRSVVGTGYLQMPPNTSNPLSNLWGSPCLMSPCLLKAEAGITPAQLRCRQERG